MLNIIQNGKYPNLTIKNLVRKAVSIYGCNITTKLKNAIKRYKKNFSKSEYSFHVKQSIDTFDVHPFMCPYCKIMMDMQEIYVSFDWYGWTIYKIYF